VGGLRCARGAAGRELIIIEAMMRIVFPFSLFSFDYQDRFLIFILEMMKRP